MNESVSATRLERPARPRIKCAMCTSLFDQNRPHQRFCGLKCKNDYHGKMTPEALRRDLDALQAQYDSMAETLKRVNADADRREAALPETTPA